MCVTNESPEGFPYNSLYLHSTYNNADKHIIRLCAFLLVTNYIVVPGVIKSLGLRRQPMKLVLLNLVPPVPYT